MKLSNRTPIALVSAFLIAFPVARSQAQQATPTIQDYAKACYAAMGIPPAGTFPVDCTTGATIDIGGGTANPQGRCVAPSWAPTHCSVADTMIPCEHNLTKVPFQCFPGSFVKKFEYFAVDPPSVEGTTVTGAVLCKNETPFNNTPERAAAGSFDYVSMILYNNTNGLSCWFTAPKGDSGVAGHETRNGKFVPDPQGNFAQGFWQAPQDTAKAHCWRCHDNGVWMNSPWLYVSRQASGGASNGFTDLKNAPRDAFYGFAANASAQKFGFDSWPAPVYVSPGATTVDCKQCHRIAAKQTAVKVSNTFNEWLGYVTGGSQSPVPNMNKDPGTQDPPGQTPGAATNQTQPFLAITHWMPPVRRRFAGDAYKTEYGADLLKLQKCMAQVGSFADATRRANRDVIAALKIASANPQAFSFQADCHVDKATFPADPAPQQQQIGRATQRRLQLSPSDDTVGETDDGLTLTASGLTAPDGTPLSPVSKMAPDAPPVDIQSSSSLVLSWDPGPNAGCSIFAFFPPGVIVPSLQPSSQPGSVGSGSNWLAAESPQGFGPLTEPGEYRFDFDCGFQTSAEVVTQTHISLNLIPPSSVSPNPPLLMTLFTATGSNNAEAVDWTSYAYPQNSYTVPAVSPGEVPQTDIPVGPSDNVAVSWVAEDVLTGSCSLSEIGGGAGAVGPITADAGAIGVTLGSAAARVFQLNCTDLNGLSHRLQARVHGAPSVKLNVVTTPDNGVSGSSYVNITGSGFPAGAVTPANVVVTLSDSCGGAPLGTTQASSVISIIGTSKRVRFLIPGLDPETYYVSISDPASGDANFASSNCSKLSVTDAVATASPP